VDSFIPLPPREIDKPFLMCIEDVFNIEGRGTVVTGRVERGELNKMSDVEIVGLKDTRKRWRRTLKCPQAVGQASAGDTLGYCCAAPRKRKSSAAWSWPSQVLLRPIPSSRPKFMCCPKTKVAGTRRFSPITGRNSISHDRRDGDGQARQGVEMVHARR